MSPSGAAGSVPVAPRENKFGVSFTSMRAGAATGNRTGTLRAAVFAGPRVFTPWLSSVTMRSTSSTLESFVRQFTSVDGENWPSHFTTSTLRPRTPPFSFSRSFA